MSFDESEVYDEFDGQNDLLSSAELENPPSRSKYVGPEQIADSVYTDVSEEISLVLEKFDNGKLRDLVDILESFAEGAVPVDVRFYTNQFRSRASRMNGGMSDNRAEFDFDLSCLVEQLEEIGLICPSEIDDEQFIYMVLEAGRGLLDPSKDDNDVVN